MYYFGTRANVCSLNIFHLFASLPVDGEEDIELEEMEKKAKEEGEDDEEDDDMDEYNEGGKKRESRDHILDSKPVTSIQATSVEYE